MKHSVRLLLAFLCLTLPKTFGVTFDQWRANYFFNTELFTPSISGPTADPDGDGLFNLSEYALGTHPRVPESTPTLSPNVEPDGQSIPHLSTHYRASSDAEGVLLLPQVTGKLGARWRADQVFNLYLGGAEDGRKEFLATDQERSDVPDHRFIRLLIAKDGDEDGLPDDLEIAWGLNPNDAFDCMADSDGDGYGDYLEFMGATDPFNASDNLRRNEIPRPPENVQIFYNADGRREVVWDDRSDNEEYFVIYHTANNGVKTEIGRVGPGRTRFLLPEGY